MPCFTDQLRRGINLPNPPKKIISLVPSQTELLFDLVPHKIIGITSFCTHPANKTKTITKIGGTKKLNIALIKELKPDLIIANKEENEQSQVEELMGFCPVWVSDINNLADAISMIKSIGEMLRCKTKANKLSSDIISRFNKLSSSHLNLRIAYLIWRKPYMVAGNDTFINSMFRECGLTNAFDWNRYPEANADMLVKANPDVVFLSSEPYPFGQKHMEEFQKILPNAKLMLVDGEMFSWYGSRLLLAPGYFRTLLDDLVHG